MKRAIYIAAAASLIILSSGCTHGGLKKWFHGASCNPCNPPLGRIFGLGGNSVSNCDSGTCGSIADDDGMSTPAGGVPYYSEPGMAGGGPSFSAPTMDPTQFSTPFVQGDVYGGVSPSSVGPLPGPNNR